MNGAFFFVFLVYLGCFLMLLFLRRVVVPRWSGQCCLAILDGELGADLAGEEMQPAEISGISESSSATEGTGVSSSVKSVKV